MRWKGDVLGGPVNKTTHRVVNRVSELQATILRDLLRRYRDIEVRGSRHDRDDAGYFGVPWHPFAGRRATGSERAAMSRALRRLESRGLVERRNSSTGDRYHKDAHRPAVTRTNRVKLTDDGRRLAERLTNGQCAS